MPVAPVKT